MDRRRGDPEDRRVDAQHQDPGERRSLLVVPDAAPGGLLVRHLSHHLDVDPAGPVDQAQHRPGNREQQAVQRPEGQHPHGGDRCGHDVVAPHPGVAAERRDVHELPDRVDHDGAEDGLGQPGERRRDGDDDDQRTARPR